MLSKAQYKVASTLLNEGNYIKRYRTYLGYEVAYLPNGDKFQVGVFDALVKYGVIEYSHTTKPSFEGDAEVKYYKLSRLGKILVEQAGGVYGNQGQ